MVCIPILSIVSDRPIQDYVLQRALTVVEGDQKEILIGKVRPQLTAMRRYSSAYSRHLVSSKLCNLIIDTNLY